MKYFRILKSLFSVFGFHFKYLILPPYRFIYFSITSFFLALDKIFYSGYSKQKIEKPVFIIGHPRSGTTFLHRFLLKESPQFTGFVVWQMLFPSLTLRKLIRPLLPKLKAIAPEKLYDPKIHKTDFFSGETDDAALFVRHFDGLFFWIYFKAWEVKPKQIIQQELQKFSRQNYLIDYLKSVYKRNLFSNGGQMLSKSFSFIINFDYLQKSFPEGRFIFLIRDPKQAIPSCLSLVRSAQSKLHAFEDLDPNVRRKYYQNLYQASCLFYETLFNLVQKKDPSILVVSHKELKQNFETSIHKIIEFSGQKPNVQTLTAIKKQEAKQSNYKSQHSYSLEEFGLSEEQIEKDFAYIYEAFDL